MTRKRPHHGSRRRGSGRAPARRREVVTGIVRVTRPGIGMVETPEGTFDIARHGMREAMNGDEVQASIETVSGQRKAFVQLVLNRAVTTFLGRYEVAGPLGAIVPLDARVGHDFFVVPEDKSPRVLGVGDGDIVVARIMEYPTRRSAPVATIDRRLGSADELDMNVESVIASHGLPMDFPPSVLMEAEEIVPAVAEALAADPARVDLRGVACVTIDPADARDFDDAVGARRRDDGGYDVDVHIADVTHYVGWDTPIDNEAKRRTCSVYLVDRVIPMLPERLCNDVCSLRPGEDRLAMTVRLHLDHRGQVTSADPMKSAIRSKARLSYGEVDALLDGSGAGEKGLSPELAEMLRVLDEVRALRERIRHDRGSIDFETREAKVVLDADGHPTGVVVRERTRATGLVEEAMLMANEAVAKVLADSEVATAYRVHERPSPDDLRATVQPLRELGVLDKISVDALVAGEPAAIQAALAAAHGTTGAYLANALLLRAQKRAVYLPHNDGHYALGAPAYCHFTSPIRRYPDDLVHRALKARLAGRETREDRLAQKALPQLCSTCSSMERTADSAARDSQKIKMAELFSTRVGERLAGVVTGCVRFGLFVMLDETCAEGLLPVRALGEHWLRYDEDRMTLTDEVDGRVWGIGQRVAVEVAGVDVARGQIDFALPGRARG